MATVGQALTAPVMQSPLLAHARGGLFFSLQDFRPI
jgi:hypothetical protein